VEIGEIGGNLAITLTCRKFEGSVNAKQVVMWGCSLELPLIVPAYTYSSNKLKIVL
jgi:hypothetical protein